MEGTGNYRVSPVRDDQVKITEMRRTIFIAAIACMASAVTSSGFAADNAVLAPPISCSNGVIGAVSCTPNKKELKQARDAFNRGVKLQERQQLAEAFHQFDKALQLMPQNPQFLTARELAKAQLVYRHVERGNAFLSLNSRLQAAAEFRAALDLDPENPFAHERLEDALRESFATVPQALPPPLANTGEIHIEPGKNRATFHYRGDVRGLFTELATAYGLTAQFDESVQSRQVRVYVDDVEFFTALKLACQVSKTMWSA